MGLRSWIWRKKIYKNENKRFMEVCSCQAFQNLRVKSKKSSNPSWRRKDPCWQAGTRRSEQGGTISLPPAWERREPSSERSLGKLGSAGGPRQLEGLQVRCMAFRRAYTMSHCQATNEWMCPLERSGWAGLAKEFSSPPTAFLFSWDKDLCKGISLNAVPFVCSLNRV